MQAAAAPAAQSLSATGNATVQATSASQVATVAAARQTVSTQASAAATLTPASAAKSSATSGASTKSTATRSSASASVSAASTTPNPTTKALSTTQKATGTYAGWTADWVDNFNVPVDQTKWVAYGYGGQAPGQGAMGLYKESNAFTSNGSLVLRTQYQNGAWSSAGISSGDFYTAVGGRWEVRAKFPVSKGIGYVFLLYPDDGSWPPEVDIAEGRVKGPQVMSTYHWGASNNQVQQFFSNPDMSGWHTYGVILGTNTITYTFDGKPWVTFGNNNITTKKLWVGFQCGAMDPNGSAKAYETVDNGVPGPLTPAVSDIQIDWVAHYTKS